MVFVVIYDACVLYPAPLRDLLLRLAVMGLVRARWTEPILGECFRNILANRPESNEAALKRTRELMNLAIPDVLVTGFEGLIPGLELPDPDERHGLAAAIRAGAQVIARPYHFHGFRCAIHPFQCRRQGLHRGRLIVTSGKAATSGGGGGDISGRDTGGIEGAAFSSGDGPGRSTMRSKSRRSSRSPRLRTI